MKKILLFPIIFGVAFASAQEKSAKDLKIEAASAYEAKDYQKGLDSFEKAIKLYEADQKVDTTLYYNAAVCAVKVNNYDKALTYFNKSIELDYKPCRSLLYKADMLNKLGRTAELEAICSSSSAKCPQYKSKFNEILFQNYVVSGLEIFNNAAKQQAEVTPLAKTNPEKYTSEMEKVKAEFTRSLPDLEKAHNLNPKDENCIKALKQAYEVLDMKDKAAGL